MDSDSETKPQGRAEKLPSALDDMNPSSSNTPRKRVSQACDRCRSRKDKCDGKKPICSTCISLGQVCSYDPSTKKRGLPEGYVRGLEKLWGLTIRDAAGIEDTILSIIDGGDAVDSRLSKVWNDRDGSSETLLETWRKSRISRELERLLPILETPEDKTGKRKRRENGQQSLTADSPVGLSQFKEQPNETVNLPYVGTGIQILSTPTVPAVGIQLAVDQSRSLPSSAWQLLDVYFSYTHCWFPIIEKHSLLKTSYQYPTNDFSTKSGDHAALWAVLAYADYQYKSLNRPNLDYQPQQSDDWATLDLYSYARSLIPNEDGIFDIGHLQALLVLTLFNMSQDKWRQAWFLAGQAARVAIDLAIGDNQDSAMVIDKRSRSKHVFLGCFTLDTLIAAYLGRKPQLRKEDIERIGRVEEDGLDEWDPWMDCLGLRRGSLGGPRGPVAVLSTFNRLIDIVKILNTAICFPKDESRAALLEELNSCCQVLNAQFRTTPSQDKSAGSPLLPHHYHVRFAQISTADLLGDDHASLSTKQQISSLLNRYSNDFGTAVVPPTFDCFLGLATRRESLESYFSDEESSVLRVLGDSWPALKQQLTTEMPDIVLASYSHPQGSTPDLSTRDRSRSFVMEMKPFPPYQMVTPIASGPPMAGTTLNRYEDASPAYKHLRLSTSNSNLQLEQFLGLSPATSATTIPNRSSTWAPSPNENQLATQMTSNQFHPQQPVSQIGSDMDGDSMFTEFATLDAMEWTNNWDQSLLNLGFTDPDNMNQDFYSFCREPDPLYPNNIVQQLLSSSNPVDSRVHNLDESFFGFTNPHVEASQILQALSAGDDHNVLNRSHH